MKIPRRPVTGVLVATLTVLCLPISAQNGVLNCASNDGRYHYCRADTQNRVRLVQQFSNSPCNQVIAGVLTIAVSGLIAVAAPNSSSAGEITEAIRAPQLLPE